MGAVAGSTSWAEYSEPKARRVAKAQLEAEITTWIVLDIDAAVARAAEKRWPVEPVRALDAIHLATLEAIRAAGVPELVLLSLDRRMRDNALGFPVLP